MTENLTLTIDGRLGDRLTVSSFRATEEVNRPCHVDITFTTDATDDNLEELLLLRPATLSVLDGAEAVRWFHGVVEVVHAEGAHQHERRGYRLRLVPRMSLLQLRKGKRAWSDVTSLDIAAELFREWDIPLRVLVARELSKRPYCVQFGETDHAFLTRLFSEDGLFFSFDHPMPAGDAASTSSVGASVVVVSDTADHYAPIDGDGLLRFKKATEGQGGSGISLRENQVTHFVPVASIRPFGARIHGYDLHRPATDLRDEAQVDPATSADVASLISAAFEGRTFTTFEGSYEDTLPSPLAGEAPLTVLASALQRLQSLRRDARMVEGASWCKRLMPCRKFALQDHELGAPDGDYVVSRVDHEGYAAAAAPAGYPLYQNRFTCHPASTPLRPAVVDKPPATRETALVVGPEGQEIHTDALGRVRVRFFWDRSRRPADEGTCWVRSAQLLAGPGWGAQFLPRVGMEVVIDYLDSDPDRPLITGCVYNATHPPSFTLPNDKTRSGIRTQSVPGGAGSNEISFEDKRGTEQIYLHAQRNLDEVIENNHTMLVKKDDFLRTLGSRMDSIEKDFEQLIKGNHSYHVDGNRIDVVAGNRDERVSGTSVERLEGKERRDVRGAANLEYADDLTTRVRGCLTTLVGKHDAKRSWVTHAEGTAKLSSLDATEVSSEGALELRVGKSSIRITKDRIEMNAPAITVKGTGGGLTASEDGLALSSAGDAQVLVEKKLVVKSKAGASLSMEKEVKIDGTKILLNSPEQASDPPPKDPDPPTKVTFKDHGGKPLPYERFVVTMDDGSEVSGVTDKDGKTEMDLKGRGTVTFPDHSPAR
jgi:type VI secretion system secreted protein VgrG